MVLITDIAAGWVGRQAYKAHSTEPLRTKNFIRAGQRGCSVVRKHATATSHRAFRNSLGTSSYLLPSQVHCQI
jgi:hypothetical protein